MSESNGAVEFGPGIKFIIAVYTVELALVFLIVVWTLAAGRI